MIELDEVRAAIKAYVNEHGVPPVPYTKRQTPGISNPNFWLTVSRQLQRGGGSLEELTESMGYGRRAGELGTEEIQQAIRRFHEREGRRPDRGCGSALPYLGRHITWAAIDARLRLQGSSIVSVCREMGLPTRRQLERQQKVAAQAKELAEAMAAQQPETLNG